MSQLSWHLSRAQDVTEKADVSQQSCREDRHFQQGCWRSVIHSPIDAKKVMPEAWPLPELLTIPQEFRSQITSEAAVLCGAEVKGRGEKLCRSWGSVVRSEPNDNVVLKSSTVWSTVRELKQCVLIRKETQQVGYMDTPYLLLVTFSSCYLLLFCKSLSIWWARITALQCLCVQPTHKWIM